MNHRPDLVRLVTAGASEAELVEFLQKEHQCTEVEAYEVLEAAGVEFGRHRTFGAPTRPLPNDTISDERRRYLQQLSLGDD
jgi:hypothetical protein